MAWRTQGWEELWRLGPGLEVPGCRQSWSSPVSGLRQMILTFAPPTPPYGEARDRLSWKIIK